MKHLTPPQHEILAIADRLHWFDRRDLTFWLCGSRDRRLKVVEYNLPRLVRRGLLKSQWRGGRKVYSAWSNAAHMGHGLICTEILLALTAAGDELSVVSENRLRRAKLGVVAEFALLYPNETMLLVEYCTADNVGRNGLVVRKVNLYQKHLWRIEALYQARGVVLFVLDTPQALRYATRAAGATFAYFVDLKTFRGLNEGVHLTAPVYIWGGDGQRYPLQDDA